MSVLFVSGGSRGIGAAVALEAVRQGWDVGISYVSSEARAQGVIEAARDIAPERKVHAWPLDVRDAPQVDSVADAVLEHFGNVDAVVCSAGISKTGLAFSMSDEDWNDVLDTNLSGAFRVCRAFLPELVAQRSGAIVLLSSVVARGATGQAAYAASKAGLEGLASALGKEYGPKGVRANAVIPGYFDTDMTKETMSAELKDFAVSYCPQRRLGRLEELAKTVMFLCGEGGGYINAGTISVTGGLDWAP